MKAITIWQPRASLVAVGAKAHETRSWATNYRGPIAIHAGLKDCADILSSEQINAVMKAFARTGYEVPHNRAGGGYDYVYPYGAIIATAELVGCWKICTHMGQAALRRSDSAYTIITGNELLFGDFTPGRYAWELRNARALPEPIPAKGRQGLWNWEEIAA